MTEAEEMSEFFKTRDEYIDALAKALRAEKQARRYFNGLINYESLYSEAKIKQAKEDLQELRTDTDAWILHINNFLSEY